MPLFSYKGRTQNGDTISGTAEAQSSQAVAEELLKQQIIPIEIVLNKKGGKNPLFEMVKNSAFIVPPVKPEEMIIFCRQVNTLLRAGVPILTILKKLTDMAVSKLLKSALMDITNDVAGGQTLASSIAKHPRVFSPVFVNLINTGENSGQLDKAFTQMGNYIQLEADTKKRIKQATRYPMIVMVVLLIAVLCINFMVVPNFKTMFESLGAELPLPTRILIGMSNGLINHWPIIFIVVIGVIMGIKLLLNKNKTVKLFWDRSKLKLPIFGSIILRVTLARFSRTLTMVTQAGVPINKALTLVGDASDNTFVAQQIYQIRDQVERGASLYVAAQSCKLFTPLVLQMLEIGEQTGMIDEMLAEVATSYEEEVDYDLLRLGDLIEPVLLTVLGGIVLLLMLGVFLPMWDMISAFGH